MSFSKHFAFLLFVTFLLSSCGGNRKPKPKNIIILNNPSLDVEVFEPGIVSTFLHERDLAVHPNGKLILFTRGGLDQKNRSLVQVRIFGDSAGVPLDVPFASQFDDIEPFFHPDGKSLFFASNRPFPNDSTRKDYNIWKINYDETTKTWGKAEPLPEVINTKSDEFYPSVAANGNLYFTATYTPEKSKEDIFISQFEKGTYSSPQALPETINSAVYEFNAYISPNEDMLIFSSYGRKNSLGGGDLYGSKKDKSGKWQEAVSFPSPINSTSLDYCPFVDWERQTFYFTSNRKKETLTKPSVQERQRLAILTENGLGDVFRVHVDKLDF